MGEYYKKSSRPLKVNFCLREALSEEAGFGTGYYSSRTGDFSLIASLDRNEWHLQLQKTPNSFSILLLGISSIGIDSERKLAGGDTISSVILRSFVASSGGLSICIVEEVEACKDDVLHNLEVSSEFYLHWSSVVGENSF
ncbi:hypothetical protein AVEN_251926-1 [Araneus ventricosus]|uniref:Uncharacterized protein n=1 Tax=Araneus ventricosus TaxID=182803 RepID=A0A4Y2GY17_ARAVE|nr:hypothetical protein AVEN_251926-1 [Araneus ventricosus]